MRGNKNYHDDEFDFDDIEFMGSVDMMDYNDDLDLADFDEDFDFDFDEDDELEDYHWEWVN